MRNRSLAALAAITGLALTAPAHAWGPIGHRTIALVAEHHLTPRALREVEKLLGPATLAEVAYWADESRALPEWKKADPWHYISIDDNETLTSTVRSPNGDVVEAIGRMEATLRDPKASTKDRADALKFLVHFIGDLHQPLHVGRRADAGGNKIDVTLNGEKANLHWVWDALLINDMGMSYTELAHQIDHASPEEITTLAKSTIADWVNDSFALRPQVYDFPEDGKLNYLYSFKNWPVIRTQLLKAGIRLAATLNAIFDPGHATR
jgi:hypothetical protein